MSTLKVDSIWDFWVHRYRCRQVSRAKSREKGASNWPSNTPRCWHHARNGHQDSLSYPGRINSVRKNKPTRFQVASSPLFRSSFWLHLGDGGKLGPVTAERWRIITKYWAMWALSALCPEFHVLLCRCMYLPMEKTCRRSCIVSLEDIPSHLESPRTIHGSSAALATGNVHESSAPMTPVTKEQLT